MRRCSVDGSQGMDVTRSGGRGGGYYCIGIKGTCSRFALSGVKKWYMVCGHRTVTVVTIAATVGPGLGPAPTEKSTIGVST